MKVLFIGGTGTISTAVSRLALERGIDLYLLNRGSNTEFAGLGAKLLTGDIRDEKQAEEILKGHTFDCVVDFISFTPAHINLSIKLFSGITKQFIFISSASAYQKPPTGFIITEQTPLVNPFWQYSRDKIDCENILFGQYKEKGFPVTIVRPSHTYGVTSIPALFNSRVHRFSIVERMRRNKPIVIPGDGSSIWVTTHNTDFAKAFVGLLGNEKAIGEAYHITSDEGLSWNQITGYLGEAAGVEPVLAHISTDFVTSCLPELHAELIGDKSNSVYFDNAKIKALVPDFKATVAFREGIRQTIDWFMRHEELMVIDEEWDALCDKLIESHQHGISYFKNK